MYRPDPCANRCRRRPASPAGRHNTRQRCATQKEGAGGGTMGSPAPAGSVPRHGRQREGRVDHRRTPRPRTGSAGRRHGAVRDPLCRTGGTRHRGGLRDDRPRERLDARARVARRRRRPRPVPARHPRGVRRPRGRGRAHRPRRRVPARPGRRPFDRAGHARRPRGRGWPSGRRPLDRRTRRPEHARDVTDRQRPRHATRCSPGSRRACLRPPPADPARRRSDTGRPAGHPLARPGRAGADPRESGSGRSR